MSFNLGHKALAYPASNLSDPVSPCQCSLAFRCDDAARQATVLLVVTVPTTHALQSFVLQYDADKLLPGTVRLSSGNSHLPQPQLDELMRDKNNKRSDIKTLALSVEQPCPLWCPESLVFAHKPGSERPFQALVELSKATTIHVVFDYKYLQKQHQGMFRAFSKAAKGLVGCPVEGILTERGLRKASWEVFGPVNDVGAPPAYDNPRKRSRQASSTSPQQSPKRFAPQSPTESHTSEKTVPLSPATADAIHTALKRASPAFDYQTEAIDAAVAKQLPIALERALPGLLRDIIPTLFANLPPQSTASTPHTSFSSSASPARPKLPKLSSLGHALLPHLRTHLTTEFQHHQTHQLQQFEKFLDSLWDTAAGARAHETALLIDEMEDHKCEMLLLREDAIRDLSSQIDEVFARGRQEGMDLGDELTERLQWVFGEVCAVIDRLKKTGVKRMVEREVGRRKSRGKGVPRGIGRRVGRGRSALLGRRREPDEVEWVDC